LRSKKLSTNADDRDDYQEYLQAVLRRANDYPDKPIGITDEALGYFL
jgi:hypothetical protein